MAHAILILQPLATTCPGPDHGRAAGAFDLMSARGCALVPFVRGARKQDDQLAGRCALRSRRLGRAVEAGGCPEPRQRLHERGRARARAPGHQLGCGRARACHRVSVLIDPVSANGRSAPLSACAGRPSKTATFRPKINSLTSQKIRPVISENIPAPVLPPCDMSDSAWHTRSVQPRVKSPQQSKT
eukprot:COSAG06_NODE_610_length_13844_cov_14.456359_2_plen_186_part_00